MIWNKNDAGLDVAELALAVEKHMLESGSIDNLGPIGNLFLIHFLLNRAHHNF